MSCCDWPEVIFLLPCIWFNLKILGRPMLAITVPTSASSQYKRLLLKTLGERLPGTAFNIINDLITSFFTVKAALRKTYCRYSYMWQFLDKDQPCPGNLYWLLFSCYYLTVEVVSCWCILNICRGEMANLALLARVFTADQLIPGGFSSLKNSSPFGVEYYTGTGLLSTLELAFCVLRKPGQQKGIQRSFRYLQVFAQRILIYNITGVRFATPDDGRMQNSVCPCASGSVYSRYSFPVCF